MTHTTRFVTAYAKINLTLAVLGRRADGYHRLASVMQTVSLGDTLRIAAAAPGEDFFTCDVAELAGPENLVARAADLLRRESGRADLAAAIELSKRIPAQGGLGGGSSDAATALVALNDLWGLGLDLPAIESLAARLGSDIPYLVYGGTGRIEERGEVVEPLPDAEPLWIALASPPVSVSTARVFGALTPADYGDASDTEALVADIRAGKPLAFNRLTNTLERPVLAAYPDVLRTKKTLLDLGAPFVVMSGSGPTLFTPYRHLDEAAALCQRARVQGISIQLCHTITRAQVAVARSEPL